jgi:phosphoribosylpyrophosphate synthetase
VDAGDMGVPVTVISIAELMGKAIMRIHLSESVSSLFRLKTKDGKEANF